MLFLGPLAITVGLLGLLLSDRPAINGLCWVLGGVLVVRSGRGRRRQLTRLRKKSPRI